MVDGGNSHSDATSSYLNCANRLLMPHNNNIKDLYLAPNNNSNAIIIRLYENLFSCYLTACTENFGK